MTDIKCIFCNSNMKSERNDYRVSCNCGYFILVTDYSLSFNYNDFAMRTFHKHIWSGGVSEEDMCIFYFKDKNKLEFKIEDSKNISECGQIFLSFVQNFNLL